MKRASAFSVVVAVVVICLIGFIFASRKGKAATGPNDTTVKVVEAAYGDSEQAVNAPGTVVPSKITDVSMLPGFAGKVSLITADVGAHVNKGDILAVIDASEQRDLLNESIAKEAQAAQNYRLVLRPYRPEQIEEQRLQVSEDQKMVDEAQAHLDLLIAGNRPEQIRQAQEAADAEQTALTNLQAENGREHELFSKDLIAHSEVDQSDTEVGVQRDKLAEAQEQLAILKAGSRTEDIQAARATADRARVALKKDREALVVLKLGSRREAIEAARQAVYEAAANMHNQEQIFAHRNIYAPVSGIVFQRNVSEGEVAGPNLSTKARSAAVAPLEMNAESLFQIADDNSMEFMANVDQMDFESLHAGDGATLMIEALPGRSFHAQVARVQPLVSPEVKDIPGKANPATPLTFTVWATISNPARDLVPGQTGFITIRKRSSGIVIPQAAVSAFTVGEGTIFVAKDGVLSNRTIHYEANSDATVRVLSGLNAGEAVVVSDTSSLSNGMHVNVQKANPADISTHAPGF